MPVTGTTTNYVGRQKDISIFHSPIATIQGAQPVTVGFGKYSQVCAGVQKLVQRYAISLLTNIGSQPDFPDTGTTFLNDIRAGISADKLQASQLFSLASATVVSTLKAYQAEHPELPADEKITRVTLLDVNLYAGTAAFRIEIKTEAGDAITFLVPLPK